MTITHVTHDMDILLAEITAGVRDEDLTRIHTAIEARLAVVRHARTSADFMIGDKVRLNDRCGTRYLIGETAQVVAKRRTKVVIKLDKPMGRFVQVKDGTPESSMITVPVSIIDKI